MYLPRLAHKLAPEVRLALRGHTHGFAYLYGGNVKKKLIAGASSLALLAGLLTTGFNTASAATIRLPKTPMNACVVVNGIYCVESVTLTTGSGSKIPLVYVLNGADVPAKKTPSDFFAPVAQVKGGKVIDNNWWLSQYQRDALASNKFVMKDLSTLLGTANHPEQGAILDTKANKYDINKPIDSYSYPTECFDPATKTKSKKTFGECFKGSVAFIVDNEVKFFFFYPTAAEAAKQITNFTDVTFVDLAELSATQLRPVWGTTYDATAKTFKETEGIIVPIWVTQNALVNGWAVAGTPAAAADGSAPPADAPKWQQVGGTILPTTVTANTPCSAAELAGTGQTAGIAGSPSNLKASVDGNGVKLTWAAPTGTKPASYSLTTVVQGGGNKDANVGSVNCVVLPWASIGATLDTMTESANGLKGYWFWVGAVDAAGVNSGFKGDSNSVYAVIDVDQSGKLTAPLAPEPGVSVGTPAEAGRALAGRWTHPDWQGLNLGALGYDGLYIESRSISEFSSSQLFLDVLPTLTGADKKVTLAGQVGNKDYAVSLDSDLVVTMKIRVGEMKTGVTVAVGVDITTLQENPTGEYNRITVTGSPVTVPLAKKAADCLGETGVAKANVRQLQMIALAANDDMSGFGVDGTSGGMYVGTNGVCSLSTPTWDETTKTFSWVAAAPHFAPDGKTVNKGFYKAVIPVADAQLLWGMTNPNDAVSALEVSLTTEAGGTAAFIKSISVKSGKIIIDVSNFEYSRPKLKIGIKKSYKPATKILNKTTITCIKGKAVKKITAVKPACPAGYKKK